MTVKAIFSGCSSLYWVDVATNLANESGWKPCYWIASPKLEQAVRDRFPDVVFHSNFDAIRGIAPRDCANLRLATLDQTLLEDLSLHESIVLEMMDRMDPGYSFNYQERVRLYHFQLMYWLAVLNHFGPDIVVFPESPHIVYDYILYILCQKRGIRTVMFEHTVVDSLVFPQERFEDGSPAIISMYKELLSHHESLQIKLSPTTEKYLDIISGDYQNAIPPTLKNVLGALQKSSSVSDTMKRLCAFHKYPHYCISLVKRAYDFIYNPAPRNYLKQKGKRIEDSHMSGLEWRLYKAKANWKKRRLDRYYEKLVQDVDLDTPYVFVPLHYQPERTTSPNGGVYANQLLMIDLLSKSVPAGWYLYVKEHITQHKPIFKGELSRTFDYYDDIVSLPNVKLVPVSLSSFDLIDNAKAVATVTGTAGWEAVLRGKPALIFGHAWYRGCEGVFYTPTQKSCKEALSKIEARYKVDSEKVRLFIYVLEQVCVRAYVEPLYEKIAGISYEENVLALTHAIQKFFTENGSET